MFRHLPAILSLGAALLAPVAAPAQDALSASLADPSPIVIAHRLAGLDGAPENSLAWIDAALALGVDMVHVNPQLTADGQYVLMHDQTLNRMTDVEAVYPDGPPGGPTRAERAGRDFVRDYTLAEIAALHLVSDDGAEHPVPTLDAALDRVGTGAIVLLGLKGYDIDSLAAALSVRETGNLLFQELYVSGTDQSRLRALADATGIGVAAVLYQSTDYRADLAALSAQLGPTLRMVAVRSSRLTPEFLDLAAELDLAVIISGWAGREDAALRGGDPGPWQALIGQGFAAMTDQPGEVLDLLGR